MPIQSDLITEIQPVQPGDLITADFVNSLVTAIWELEDRLSALEAEGSPRQPLPDGDGDTPSRFAIDFASATVGREDVLFEVQGSGLTPTGLKSFAVNNRAFAVRQLTGDDETIRFSAPLSAFGSSGGVPTLGERFAAGGGGSGGAVRGSDRQARVVLQITAKNGAKAQRQLTVDTE